MQYAICGAVVHERWVLTRNGSYGIGSANGSIAGAAVGAQFDIHNQPLAERLGLDYYLSAVNFLAKQFPDATVMVVGYLTAVSRIYSPC